jgi:hypothetical protein
MKAGDDEETSVKLLQTAENFVYLYDFLHEYYANNKKKDAAWHTASNIRTIHRADNGDTSETSVYSNENTRLCIPPRRLSSSYSPP